MDAWAGIPDGFPELGVHTSGIHLNDGVRPHELLRRFRGMLLLRP